MTIKRFDALSATTLSSTVICATNISATSFSAITISSTSITATSIHSTTITATNLQGTLSSIVAISGGKVDLAVTNSAAGIIWRGDSAASSSISADVMIRFYNPDGIVIWVPACSAIASG